MTDATHALCPKCSQYAPVIWTKFTKAEVHSNGKVGWFDGLEMKCRLCQFKITDIGVVYFSQLAASTGAAP